MTIVAANSFRRRTIIIHISRPPMISHWMVETRTLVESAAGKTLARMEGRYPSSAPTSSSATARASMSNGADRERPSLAGLLLQKLLFIIAQLLQIFAGTQWQA